MRTRIALTLLLAVIVTTGLRASGRAGIYGVIERVVFEPDSKSPERVQVWGAFALIERMSATYAGPNMTRVEDQVFTNYQYQRPTRGYLYFKLPQESSDIANARREWADLAAIAGAREAVAFGMWDRFRGDTRLMRIRTSDTKAEDPDVYLTNVGVAKLGTTGNHASIVVELLKLVPR